MLSLLLGVFVVTLQETQANAEIKLAYNLMLVHEASGVNLENYWDSGPDNDPNGNKSSLPVTDIIQGGNFRSALVDDWFLEPPDEVALYVLDMIGNIRAWFVFNTSDITTESLQSWLTAETLVNSSFNINMELSVSWMYGDRQLKIASSAQPNITWFAVIDRNISSGGTQKPSFLVPLNSNVPFNLPDPLTVSIVGTGTEAYSYEIDLVAAVGHGPLLVSNIMIGAFSMPFILEYSLQPCANQNKTGYVDPNTGVYKIFKGDIVNSVEVLYVRCLWINMVLYAGSTKTVTVFQPVLEDDFVSFPVLLFKGYWYKDSLTTGSFGETSYPTTSTTKPIMTTQTSEYIDGQATTKQGSVATSDSVLTSTGSESIADVYSTVLTTVSEGTNYPTTSTTRPITMTRSSEYTDGQSTSVATSSTQDSVTISDVHTTVIAPTETSISIHDVTSPKVCDNCGTQQYITTTTEPCTCPCSKTSNSTVFDLEQRLNDLHAYLAIDKQTLSSYKRSRESAHDDRPSATFMGYTGGIILFVCVLVVVASDAFSLIDSFRKKRTYKLS